MGLGNFPVTLTFRLAAPTNFGYRRDWSHGEGRRGASGRGETVKSRGVDWVAVGRGGRWAGKVRTVTRSMGNRSVPQLGVTPGIHLPP